jgi:hypothetical protein
VRALSNSGRHSPEFEFLLLTDLSRDNLLNGATDPDAIASLLDALPAAKVMFLPSLHAKVYVANADEAVITSSNMTANGLWHNLEYGVLIQDRDMVGRIRADITEYAELGSPIDAVQLRAFSVTARELRTLRQAAERSIRARLRREFDLRLREAEDEILRARAAGCAPHALFSQAILHILRHGPLTTTEIHRRVKEIHPDLCDDTVDRVIDGQHFGKKWKHAVRTAQQHLKKQGQVELADSGWRLCPM